jgi:hypothetical protein
MPRQRHSIGDGPIQPEYENLMRDITTALDRAFNGEARGQKRKTGFVLLVFPFGSGDGRCNYVSNGADRRDIVLMMKQQIARFEGQSEIPGSA